MVRTVTPFLLSSLALGLTVELTEFNANSHATLHPQTDADQLYAQADRGDDGGPYRGSSERRVLRPTQPLDS
jgi:hypothetical protein